MSKLEAIVIVIVAVLITSGVFILFNRSFSGAADNRFLTDNTLLVKRIENLENQLRVVTKKEEELSEKYEALIASEKKTKPVQLNRDNYSQQNSSVSRDELKVLVEKVMEEKRRKEIEEHQAQLKKNQEELNLLSQGRYGEFNHTINSIGKLLGLTDLQKDEMQQILKEYTEKQRSLSSAYSNITQADDPQQQLELEREYTKEAQQNLIEFKRKVESILNPVQLEKYKQVYGG
ncbi:MAG: hypothetical protein ABIH42_11005 [Planctomycetota bacterium]